MTKRRLSGIGSHPRLLWPLMMADVVGWPDCGPSSGRSLRMMHGRRRLGSPVTTRPEEGSMSVMRIRRRKGHGGRRLGVIAVSALLGLLTCVLGLSAGFPAGAAALGVLDEFPICTNAASQTNPVVSGDIVVWEDYRSGTNYDIYGKDLSTGQEFPICVEAHSQSAPAISGDIVVWQDERNGGRDIYGYSLATKQEFAVCTQPGYQEYPAVSGDIIVWEDDRGGSGDDIYGYDLATKQEFPICTRAGYQWFPAISDGTVVWYEHDMGRQVYYDIYGKDLSTGEEFPVCVDYSSAQTLPAISGDIVVWQDNRGGAYYDVYGYDLATKQEFPVCVDAGHQQYPAIADGVVVWDSMTGAVATADIYGSDVVTGQQVPVCTASDVQRFPSISGDTVVWYDARNGNADIYGATLELTTPQPPVVTSYSPQWGLIGNSVTVTGTGFTGATAVKFGGTAAIDFTVDSDTQITATVPAGAKTGILSVTTPYGTANGPLFFHVVAPADGGWTLQSQPITASLRSVTFIDKYHGWAVGDAGKILTTSNAGATWSTEDSGLAEYLTGVAFVDASRGWATSADGTVIATTSGGATWSVQRSSPSQFLTSIAFADTSHGWAVGQDGVIIATNDGGATWSVQASGTTRSLLDIACADEKHAWAVGAYGIILATKDGGATWTTQASGTSQPLSGVDFADVTDGWAVGAAGTVVATKDGGVTWSAQDSGGREGLRRVVFADATHGWVVGAWGVILATVDGGTTWSLQSPGTGEILLDVDCGDDTRVWAVGENGTILATTTAGQPPGRITGTVTDGAAGLEGILVRAWRYFGSTWSSTWAATTAADGTYELGSLPPGPCRVSFYSNSTGYYVQEYYDNVTSISSAKDLSIGSGATTSGIDAVLALGGRISGTVRAASGGLQGIRVNAYRSNGAGGWESLNSVTTSAGGAFNLGPVPTGTVKLWFLDSTGAYVSEYYSDKRSLAEGDDVPVAAGATSPGIDVLLEPAGFVAGKVTDAGGIPLPNITVIAYQAEVPDWTRYTSRGSAHTLSDGSYKLSGLAAGTYRLSFYDPTGSHVMEFYDDKVSAMLGDDVEVTVGQTQTGINAALVVAGRVSGTVTDASGSLAGIQVNAWVSDGSGGWRVAGTMRTIAGGTYDLGGLPPGPCRIQFADPAGAHRMEYYDDKSSIADAGIVNVAAGATTTGVDAFLAMAPTISSFSPLRGSVGTTVTVSGSGFTGVTGVTFAGTAAGFAVVSDTQLTATVPAGASSGPIRVTVPGVSVTSTTDFTVTESVPPTTTAVGLQDSATIGWTTSSQQVTLTAADNTGGSGVKQTLYTLDGAQLTYTAPFTVSGNGSHRVTYWSVDNEGNAESPHTGYVNIDTRAPATDVIGYSGAWTNGPVTLRFSADDFGGSGVAATQYSANGGKKWITGTSYTVSGSGQTTVSYRSSDRLGNTESAKTVVVRIDTAAPSISISAPKSNARYTRGAVVRVAWSVADSLSGVLTSSAPLASGQLLDTSTAGTFTFTVTATDNAGNTAMKTVTYSVK
jgi:beta propeller repeat protein